MAIILGTDHAGFLHKEAVKEFLTSEGIEVVDVGAFELDESDDYPDFVFPVAKAVQSDINNAGIIFGGTGQGEAVVANRHKGVRTTVYYGGPSNIITLGREHNNSNILSIGARFVSIEECIEAVKLWLQTDFTNDERHVRRNNKIDSI